MRDSATTSHLNASIIPRLKTMIRAAEAAAAAVHLAAVEEQIQLLSKK
jgi:hypothetical protein